MATALDRVRDAVRAREATVEVFGMGYVGFPLAVRLAGAGMRVRGIDVNTDRVARLSRGELLDTEKHLEKPFLTSREDGRLLLGTTPEKAPNGKIGLICVPTPVPTDSVSSSVNVYAAVDQFLETCGPGDVLIIESSVEVGTTDQVKEKIASAGHDVGRGFGLAFCPERIDPQNGRWTLENIPRIIYCSDDVTYEIAKDIYFHVNNSNLQRVASAKVAEVTKSFENAFRLVNISLVNELAILCDKLGINVRQVIDSAATKPFGFMPFYPGAGAGGHCIPKDPVFLLESSKKVGHELKTISNAIDINQHMPKYVARTIDGMLSERKLPRAVLVYGMAYKPDTEDMRDSPGFKIVRELAGIGYRVGVYDPYLRRPLVPKYIKENHMASASFDIIDELPDASNSRFACLCVCQHHRKTAPLLENAYRRGVFPMIYDCRGRLRPDGDTPTILRYLGS